MAASRPIRFAGTIVYLLASAAFVVIVVESFVRIWLLPKDFLFYKVSRKEFPYFRLVDSYTSPSVTIANGRRELGPRGARPRSVAFVGDSNTFGAGASDEDTYEELIQSHQNQWDAYNFGVPGYGLPEVLSVVDSITSQRHFDVVAYNFNFNDAFVAMAGYMPLLSRPDTRLRTIDQYEGRYGQAKLFAKDHLKFLFVAPTVIYAANALKTLGRERASGSTTAADSSPGGDDCYERQLKSIRRGAALIKPYNLFDAMYGDASLLAEVTRYFQKLRDLIASRNGRLVVFVHYDFPIMALPMDAPRRRVDEIIERLGIRSLDSFDLYRRHHRECDFYVDAGHLGPVGNRYVSELVAGYLAGAADSR